jgi:hypothetical protein
MKEENLVEALNLKTGKVEAVLKTDEGLFDFITGEKLENWIEIVHIENWGE